MEAELNLSLPLSVIYQAAVRTHAPRRKMGFSINRSKVLLPSVVIVLYCKRGSSHKCDQVVVFAAWWRREGITISTAYFHKIELSVYRLRRVLRLRTVVLQDNDNIEVFHIHLLSGGLGDEFDDEASTQRYFRKMRLAMDS